MRRVFSIYSLWPYFLLGILTLSIHSASGYSTQSDIDELEGDWSGVLEVGSIRLRLVFHITCSNDTCSGTLDSLDQGVTGIPLGSIRIDKDTVSIEVPSVNGIYRGQWDRENEVIKGTWTQFGQSTPLDLKKGISFKPISRPQDPKPPYPYRVEEVTFDGGDEGVKLAGTLTLPDGKGPFPAVVLITGSGPQNRDEFIAGHRPFLVLADRLTRAGVAVLRYDDRGVAQSTGNFATATLDDFIADAESAVRFLASRDDIDRSRLGVLGHSEGGYVAIHLASKLKYPELRFIILLSGPSVKGRDVLILQNERILQFGGASSELTRRYVQMIEKLTAIAIDDQLTLEQQKSEIQKLLKDFAESLSEEVRRLLQLDEQSIKKQVEIVTSPWFRSFLKEDPQPLIPEIKASILAIYGEKDLQVPPDQNIPALIEQLEKARHPDYAVVKFKGLNHLLQPSLTGHPSEYSLIETTLAEEVLDTITTWMKRFIQ